MPRIHQKATPMPTLYRQDNRPNGKELRAEQKLRRRIEIQRAKHIIKHEAKREARAPEIIIVQPHPGWFALVHLFLMRIFNRF